jgi:hypothetical protein
MILRQGRIPPTNAAWYTCVSAHSFCTVYTSFARPFITTLSIQLEKPSSFIWWNFSFPSGHIPSESAGYPSVDYPSQLV